MGPPSDALVRSLRHLPPPRHHGPDDAKKLYPKENDLLNIDSDIYWRSRALMEAITDSLEKHNANANGIVRNFKAFKQLDTDNDNYISVNDLAQAVQTHKIGAGPDDIYALFNYLDLENKGS